MKLIESYKFSELNEDIQAKVLDKYRYINVEIEDFSYLLDEWKARLAEIGLSEVEFSYSGFGSQGDGLSFKGSFESSKFMADNFAPLKAQDTCIHWEKIGHRPHDSWQIIQSNWLGSDELDKLSDEWQRWINEYHSDLCHEIYRSLEKDYEYFVSNEAVKETIESNEYYFLANGTMV